MRCRVDAQYGRAPPPVIAEVGRGHQSLPNGGAKNTPCWYRDLVGGRSHLALVLPKVGSAGAETAMASSCGTSTRLSGETAEVGVLMRNALNILLCEVESLAAGIGTGHGLERSRVLVG